jgi:DNA-directed RNA polymerase specialized sigma24 family protein
MAGTEGEPAHAQAALAQLCQTYWSPLYAFVRSRGHAVPDAQDLTQSFFAYLIERKIYAGVDREKGKFRSFLLASLKNFLGHAYDRDKRRSVADRSISCLWTRSGRRRRSHFSRRITGQEERLTKTEFSKKLGPKLSLAQDWNDWQRNSKLRVKGSSSET